MGTKQQQEGEGLVVVGEATRRAPPDTAEVLVTYQLTGANPVQALRENASRTLNVVRALTAMGVEQKDIHTTWLSVGPVSPAFAGYAQAGPGGTGHGQHGGPAPHGGGDSQVIGHHVSGVVRARLNNVSRFEEFAATALMSSPDINVAVSFGLSDETPVRCAALEEACRSGRAKAEAIAKALGRQLGDSVSVVEDAFWAGVHSVYNQGLSDSPGGAGVGPHNPLSYLAAAGAGLAPISRGELTFVARVRMTYTLR